MANAGLRVGFVGAGTVNFGSIGSPWNHASRLERIPDISVVGIADVLHNNATKALQSRRQGPHGAVYEECVIYKDLETLLMRAKPDVVILGIPPSCRGSLEKGRDAVLSCIKAGIHVFVEKPLSNLPPEEFSEYLQAVEEAQKESNAIVSVGYMFRYHAAVKKMSAIIKDNGGTIRALSAVYHFAYPEGAKPHWWDCRLSGGPIVEQATHLCDIARFLGGEIIEDSIQAVCQKTSHTGSALTKLPAGCDVGLPECARVPRATMATWRFEAGGIGSLCHTIALHGLAYEAYMDVLLEGIRIRLLDPYGPAARLEIRGLAEDPEKEEIFHFGDCDYFMEELETFIKAVRTGDRSIIASSYNDAAKTYRMTWAIRRRADEAH